MKKYLIALGTLAVFSAAVWGWNLETPEGRIRTAAKVQQEVARLKAAHAVAMEQQRDARRDAALAVLDQPWTMPCDSSARLNKLRILGSYYFHFFKDARVADENDDASWQIVRATYRTRDDQRIERLMKQDFAAGSVGLNEFSEPVRKFVGGLLDIEQLASGDCNKR